MQRMREIASAAGAVVLVGASIASADIGDPVVVFEATSSAGTGTFSVSQADGAWNGSTWMWMTDTPIEITNDQGLVIATLTNGSMFVDEDPVVALGFSVLAGASDTTFSIASATVSFPEIVGAEGRASAGLTLTESDGDTASLTGLLGGGTAYQADSNLGTFTNLLAGPFVENSAFGTTDATDEFPGGGSFVTIGDVSEISVDWEFELSANDQASGTSVFVVVPAPGSLALIALGGLTLRRRR